MLIRRLLICGALCCLAPEALAYAQATAEDEEIGAIREEMKRLEERLQKLEASRAGSSAKSVALEALPPSSTAETKIAAEKTAPSPSPSADAPSGPPSPGGKAFASYQPSISISGSTAGGTATVTLGNFPRLKPTKRDDWFAADTQRLEFSAPLSKDGGLTSVTTLDGLADGAKVKFVYSHIRRRVGDANPSTDLLEELARLQEECVRDAQDRVEGAFTEDQCRSDDMRGDVLDRYGSKQIRRAFRETAFPGRYAFAFGGSVALGYKNFKFVDQQAIMDADVDKYSLEIGGYFSALPTAVASSATVSVAYQRAFKDAKAGVLCPRVPAPSNDPGFLCLSGPLGRPVSNNKALVAVDYRRYLPPIPIVGRAAISPQITYDFQNDEAGFDLPIYFVPNDKSLLIGGLRIGYGTEKNEFVAGVFIDAPFSIFR